SGHCSGGPLRVLGKHAVLVAHREINKFLLKDDRIAHVLDPFFVTRGDGLLGRCRGGSGWSPGRARWLRGGRRCLRPGARGECKDDERKSVSVHGDEWGGVGLSIGCLRTGAVKLGGNVVTVPSPCHPHRAAVGAACFREGG